MNEINKFDKWLVEKVEEYKSAPSQSSKEKFFDELGQFTPDKSANSTSANGRWSSLLALLLITVSGLVLLNNDSAQSFTELETVKQVSEIKKQYSNSTTDLKITKSNLIESVRNKAILVQTSTSTTASTSTTDIHKSNSSRNEGKSTNNTSSDHLQTVGFIKEKPGLKTTDDITSSKSNDLSTDDQNESEYSLNADSKEISQVSEKQDAISQSIDPDKKDDHGIDRFLNQSLSIYYRPEIIYNVIGNEKYIHNFGIDWNTRLFNGNYLLGTGLGLSLTRGYYEYAVEYKEYLGTYNRLDSISFNWVSERFMMEQTLHTSSEEVFDTAVTTQYARVDRNFKYLQIPVTLGYDFWKNDNNMLGLRFAPVLSVLLSKKPVDFKYEPGNNKLVQINRITPDRVKTNWQLNAGVCYSRRLSESLWLEFEPRVSYYFNSVYEKSDNSSSPMGASIRVAVGIKY